MYVRKKGYPAVKRGRAFFCYVCTEYKIAWKFTLKPIAECLYQCNWWCHSCSTPYTLIMKGKEVNEMEEKVKFIRS